MVRINLLPWRQWRRDKQQKRFYFWLVLSALGALATLGVGYHYQKLQLERQKKRNAFLQEEIARLDFRIRKIKQLDAKIEKFLSRKEVVEKLQDSSFNTVILFNELKKRIPNGVYLTSLEERGGKLRLRGVADSETAVAVLMKAFEVSPYLDNTKLRIIEKKERIRIFELHATFRAGSQGAS